MEEVNRDDERKLDYIPVVFPGLSGHNLSHGDYEAGFDHVQREGGEFLWRQIFNVLKLKATTVYVATWDG